ncbi:major facilitator superfamily domain-containing protein [Lasiosphaeria miniovina]|uniref:Major facilitator superfamily domain-containing protein n=1 Tax=Lasiosphaeria miniovina TaxID=1954250 RepID=A0AA40EF73_9PEZI|nr:major facilitator superfamily domain-containing protein [Lasiosphaeria miniovina]KAK0733068.1 major facilitator superfamily domain-containing protein [Lasiosphaeria miniovina]
MERILHPQAEPLPKNDGLDRTHTTASSYTASSLPLGREIVFVAVVCCAQLTTQAGLGQSLSIAHVIGRSYGVARPEDLAWFLAAYSLTVGTFILVSGRLGDLYGHKRMLVVGYVWFGVWSIVTGLAVYSDVVMFDICRALQGIGPSILLPNGLAILGSTRIDIVGALIGIISLLLINVAWNQAPVAGWQEPYVYILLIIGVLLISAFLYVELRVAKFPLLPLDALESSDIGFVLGCLACGWGSFGVWFYYLWQFYLELRGASPLLATAWICPVAVSGAMAAVATGFLLSRMGPAWTMVAAMSAFFTGITLIATMPIDQTYWAQAFVCVLVITWGMDMSFPAATVILSNAVRKRHQGVAMSLVNTVVNYSISLALGFASTAEVQVNPGGTSKESMLAGYRAALYVGMGLAGTGWLLSLVYLLPFPSLRSRRKSRSPRGDDQAA